MTRILMLFLIPLLVGCATGIQIEPVAADHPASPDAFEAPPASPSMMLREESQDRERTDSSEPSAPGHSHEGMQPRSGGEKTADTASGELNVGMAYTCSMHPEVVQVLPGSCPECGMDLVVRTAYTCSMHPEVIQAQPGNCPKCGMDLVVQTPYTCSMHPEVIQMEPGICPECGMSLVKRKGKPE